jgi:hypothetical protein
VSGSCKTASAYKRTYFMLAMRVKNRTIYWGGGGPSHRCPIQPTYIIWGTCPLCPIVIDACYGHRSDSSSTNLSIQCRLVKHHARRHRRQRRTGRGGRVSPILTCIVWAAGDGNRERSYVPPKKSGSGICFPWPNYRQCS